MKNKKFLCTIFIFSIFTFSGCKSKEVSKNIMVEDKNQYINILLDKEISTLDQAKESEGNSSQVLIEVNEALTRVEYNSHGKEVIKPAGAEKWEVSEDGLKWTFFIRDNNWSDGKKVTAKDYEYGIKRVLNPKLESKNAFLLYEIKGARNYNTLKKDIVDKKSDEIVQVKAVDDKILQIELEEPCPYFINLTSSVIMQPQRKDIVEKYGELNGIDKNSMIFSGPFIIKEWSPKDKIELVKNEKYWDSKNVKLQRITMKTEKGESDSISDFVDGSIDIIKVEKPYLKDKLENMKKFDKVNTYKPSINFEVYNQKYRLFSNIKVRRAFSLAVDREEIANNLYKNFYTAAYAWVPPSIQIGEESFREKSNFEPIKKMKEDNKEPKKLLIEGLRELGLDSDPSKITIKYLQPGMDSNQKQIAEVFQRMYNKNLGINIKIEYVDWDIFKDKLSKGNYQMASMLWTGDYNDPMTAFEFLMKDSKIINTSREDEKYDNLIKKASLLSEYKNQDRFKLLKDAENILLVENAEVAPTVYANKYIYKQKHIKGIITPAFGVDMELKYAYTQGR